MKTENETVLQFPSLSANEAFARQVTAAFAAQMDPTLEELGDVKTAATESEAVYAVYSGCAVCRGMCWKSQSRIGVRALRTWRRPGSPCSPPGAQSAPAWALPSWRAL